MPDIPSWLILFAGVVAAAGLLVLVLLIILYSLRREIRQLRKSDSEALEATPGHDALEIGRLWREKYERARAIANKNGRIALRRQDHIEQLRVQFQELSHLLEQTNEQLNDRIAGLEQQRGQLESDRAAREDHLRQLNLQIAAVKDRIRDLEQRDETALDQQGRVWERPVADGAPAFVPASERKACIVSVINLKGGVGKTTLTANLAALLGQRGARVLMLDLDYQRSLSCLCCEMKDLRIRHLEKQSIQHFLLGQQPLVKCITPVALAQRCDIVVCTEALAGEEMGDTLEDAEMHLLVDWLIHADGPDVRLRLRQALHSSPIAASYDYILLDCPPRLSTGCVNGLAASDFALVPVLLDETSAVSVPNLLRKLRRLCQAGLLARLRILGVVANRTQFYREEIVADQRAVWQELATPCELAWGEKVHFFATTIKQDSAFAAAANEGRFAIRDPRIEEIFAALAGEIKERLKHERQSLAAVLA